MENWSTWFTFLMQGLTFLSFAVAAWQLRNYSGQTAQATTPFTRHLGQRASVEQIRSRAGVVVAVLLSFEVPQARRFFLRKEGLFDRMSKGLRLTTEAQAAHAWFDRLFFIDTQDQSFLQLLRTRSDLRAIFIKLMSRDGCTGIACEDGWLRIRLGLSFIAYGEGSESAVIAALTPLLEAIYALPVDASAKRRKHRARVELPFFLTLVFILTGLLTLNFLLLFASDRLLEPYALFRFSLIAACAPIIAFVLWAHHRASDRANRHRWLLMWLLVAAPGLTLLSFAALRSANILFDTARPEHVAVTNVYVRLHAERRRGETPRLSFRSTDTRLQRFSYPSIDRNTYDRLTAAWGGDSSPRATMLLHPGALGFEWAEIAR